VKPETRALAIQKLKASGTHLLLSVLVFVGIIWVCIELWYPPPFFWIDGGIQVTQLAALVDLVLGPLLTLVVFRRGKKELVRDLAIIGLVQVGFLVWGVSVLYRERPLLAAFIGFPSERFFPIPGQYLADSRRPIEEMLALSSERPPMVAIRMPADKAEAREIVRVQLKGLPSVFRQPERYEKLEGQHLDEMFKVSRTLERIKLVWPESVADVEKFAADRGKPLDAFAFIPVHGRFHTGLLAFEKPGGRLAGAIYLPVKK
jgi:hypothetical protein